MLKITGIILISAGITMAGCYKAHKVKEGILTRKALYGLILHIKSKIESSAARLPEIYSSYDSAFLNKTGFTIHLKKGEIDAFSKALDCTPLNLPLSLLKTYKELASKLGKSRSVTEEARLLDDYACEIRAEEEKIIKNDEAKLVLYRKLGIIAGLLAALLLA